MRQKVGTMLILGQRVAVYREERDGETWFYARGCTARTRFRLRRVIKLAMEREHTLKTTLNPFMACYGQPEVDRPRGRRRRQLPSEG